MQAMAFFQALKAGELAPVYLFYGTEQFVLASALAQLREKVLPKGLEALCETVLQNPTADAFAAACETLPMMGETRLVLVHDLALLTPGRARDEANESARYEQILSQLPPFTLAVFVVDGPMDGRKKLAALLNKQAVAVAFDPLGDSELVKWIRSQAKRHGKGIEPPVAQYLVFTAGRDLNALKGEIDKLAAFLGEREQIVQGDIDSVVTKSLECTIFQMVDALVARQEGQAFTLLDTMLAEGATRIGILAMMLRQFRILLLLSALKAEGAPAAEQMRLAGISSFPFNRARDQLRGFSHKQLQQAVALCLDTEYAIKAGRLREEIALERAMLHVCSQIHG